MEVLYFYPNESHDIVNSRVTADNTSQTKTRFGVGWCTNVNTLTRSNIRSGCSFRECCQSLSSHRKRGLPLTSDSRVLKEEVVGVSVEVNKAAGQGSKSRCTLVQQRQQCDVTSDVIWRLDLTLTGLWCCTCTLTDCDRLWICLANHCCWRGRLCSWNTPVTNREMIQKDLRWTSG